MDTFIRNVKIEGMATSANKWFNQKEKLVNQIRHGAVHYAWAHGVGQTFSPRGRDGDDTKVFRVFSPGVDDDDTTSFLWIGEGSRQKQIPIDEVLSRLDTACELLKDTILEQTTAGFIRFA